MVVDGLSDGTIDPDLSFSGYIDIDTPEEVASE